LGVFVSETEEWKLSVSDSLEEGMSVRLEGAVEDETETVVDGLGDILCCCGGTVIGWR
jgi:hypothetical protein